MRLNCLFAAIVLAAAMPALADVQPRFDPNDVVHQLRSQHLTAGSPDSQSAGLDDGEFLVDTSISRGPAMYNQQEPSVALDGTNFLVVWQDEGGAGICGCRVSQAGAVLDPSGIAISTAGGREPAVVFDGTDFFVVWTDQRNGIYNPDVYGARVTRAGAVLDPSGIAISTAAYSQYRPTVAFDGTNLLVTWADGRSSNYDIYGARVTPSGIVLDSTGIAVSTAVDDQNAPAVAFDGTSFLVVWQDARSGRGDDIYGARVTPSGAVLDSSGIAVSTAVDDQGNPALAFDGTNFLAVWQDVRTGVDDDVYAARVNQAGVVLDPSGIAVSTAAYWQVLAAVAFDGTDFLVVWQDARSNSTYDIYGARVSQAGVVLAGIRVCSAAGHQQHPSVAFADTNFLVVWQDVRSSRDDDVYAARVTPSGTVLDPSGIVVSTVSSSQYHPAVASDSANFLAVWEDWRGGADADVYGARVTPSGTVLDPSSIALSRAALNQNSAAVAFGGTNYLVVWEDYRQGTYSDIYGARVTLGGLVLDPGGIAISTAARSQRYPAIAFDGENFLVVWQGTGSGSIDIYGARVTPYGTVLDSAGIAISTAAYGQYFPAIAYDGAGYLVVWQDERSGGSPDIYGARVTPGGTVLDPQGVAVSTAAFAQYYPALTFGGANFLVVWTDVRGGSDWDIYGARVTPSAMVLDPSGIAVSTAPLTQGCPVVAFEDTSFFVAWQDWRTGSDLDIYGARVTSSGAVSDSGLVVGRTGDQRYPRLRRCTGGQVFLVYQGWAGTVNGKTYNTDRIWGKLNPSLGVEDRPVSGLGRNADATIVRGVLLLAPLDISAHSSLYDMSGRCVMSLCPGPNDVSRLAPGVYFFRCEGPNVRRVIVTR